MGLFGLFKKSPIIHDEDFGEMRFYSAKKGEDKFFETQGYFLFSQRKVSYSIRANENGPTKEQRDFLKFLNEHYIDLTEKMKPLIIEEFSKWKENFVITDFDKEFIPENIVIPQFNGNALIWEISFTTIHDKNHWVTIDFIDFEHTGVFVDG